MVFTLSKIWKLMLTIVFFWVFYTIVGFEITTITILAAILGNFWSNSNILV